MGDNDLAALIYKWLAPPGATWDADGRACLQCYDRVSFSTVCKQYYAAFRPLDKTGTQLTNFEETFDSFDGIGLKDELLRGVREYGFDAPSGFMKMALKPMMMMRDWIAEAPCGTVKTVTIVTGLMQSIDLSNRYCQALLLLPTREWASSAWSVSRRIGMHLGVTTMCTIGGTNVRQDMDKLRAGSQLVVSTPGRTHDMIRRRALAVDHIKYFVVDEIDEMLRRGFKDLIYDVFELLPAAFTLGTVGVSAPVRRAIAPEASGPPAPGPSVAVGLFTSRMDGEILEMSRLLFARTLASSGQFPPDNPVRITVMREKLTLDLIKQFCVTIDREEHKVEMLVDFYETLCRVDTQAMVFVNTRRKLEWLTERMHARDLMCSAIHADLSQKERELILRDFRSGSVRMIITTDVLTRCGIDTQQASHLINYELPTHPENYIHRIGRTGRFGRKGVAINFLTAEDVGVLREIEQFYSTQTEEMPRP